MKKYIAIAMLAVFGCGAAEDGDSDFIEFGTLDQAIITGDHGSGFSTANQQHLACAQPGTSSQACDIPQLNPTLTIGYCFDASVTAADAAQLSAAIQNVDAQISPSYVFSQVSSPCTLTFQGGVALTGLASNIDDYMKFTPTGTTVNLTSPAGPGHVNGTWKSFTKGIVGIDTANLSAAFPATQNRRLVLDHIGGHAAMLMLGHGTVTTAGSTSPARRAVMPTVNVHTLTTGQKCRINQLNGNVSQTQVTATTVCPA